MVAACVTMTSPVAAATAGQVSLLSHVAASPTTAAVGSSSGQKSSADGAYVVFESTAETMVAGQTDNNAGTDVFLSSRATGVVILVSHTSAGPSVTGNLPSGSPRISADGAWVVFQSQASNLVTGLTDSNNESDVFLFSRATGSVTLVSRGSAAATVSALGVSGSASISADGAYVAFLSSASDISPGDANGKFDVFLFTRATNAVTLVSHLAGDAAASASGESTGPLISMDGSAIVFESFATDLVAGQVDPPFEFGAGISYPTRDIFLFDRTSGGVLLVSHTPTSTVTATGGSSFYPSISSDGAFVAFSSNEIFSGANVYLFSRATGVVTLVSHTPGDTATKANNESSFPVISGDGGSVVFQSQASNLVPAQVKTTGIDIYDVYLYSRATEAVSLVSHASYSRTATAIGFSGSQSISADGAFVAFSSDAPNLIDAGDVNGLYDVFLYTTATGRISLVSHDPSNVVFVANGHSEWPSISADGAVIAFQSTAAKLVTGQTDTNGTYDVFLFSRVGDEGTFTPLTPARILDTRNGTGGLTGAVGPGATVDVQVTGRGGVPASGVSAVAMNVTVTQPTGAGYLTLFPAGTTRPLAANLNFTPNKTVPNLVVVKLGTSGKVSMFNSLGSTHVIYDVAGWYSTTPSGNTGRFSALVPARILDTRGGVRLTPGASMDLQVSGQGGVPATGVSAAVLNVAVTGATAVSYLTVYPTGGTRPEAANLNYVAGDTVSNRVMAKLGTGGKVTLYNNAGSTDVVVDVGGWYTDASQGGTTGAYTALVPARVLDTRDGTGGVAGAVASNTGVDIQLTGVAGVPATGVSAVILNATVTQPAGQGYLTISPTGTARPLASDLNYATDETRPNLVVVRVGAGGKVNLYTSTTTHVVFDVAGWFS